MDHFNSDIKILKYYQWMLSAEKRKVRRWTIFLQQYDLTIKNIAARQNMIADQFSRSQPEYDSFNDDADIEIPTFNVKETGTEQNNSQKNSETFLLQNDCIILFLPSYREIREAIIRLKKDKALTKETYQGDNGIRYSNRSHKMFVPKLCRSHFIYWLRESRYSGHSGINRMTNCLKKWLQWPKMRQDIAQFIERCLTYIRHRPLQKPLTISNTLQRPEPLELISLDCVGPRKWKGKDVHFICVIDHYSRFIILESVPNKPTSKDIITCLQHKWNAIFQMPAAVLTDKRTEFTSTEFTAFVTSNMGCVLCRSSPYYPQGNSINESSHRSIGLSLTMLEKDESCTFEEALLLASSIHNSSPHTATNNTPFFILFGFEPTLPGWQRLQQQNKSLKQRGLVKNQEKARNTYRNLLMQEEQNE